MKLVEWCSLTFEFTIFVVWDKGVDEEWMVTTFLYAVCGEGFFRNGSVAVVS